MPNITRHTTPEKTWLVQRIKRGGSNEGGIDQRFRFDYMGSSEFEWGALPAALRRMMDQETIQRLLAVPGGVAHYVGPESLIDEARAFFTDQIGTRKDGFQQWELKERSEISDVYHPGRFSSSVIGWWSIDQDWVLFKSKADADAWVEALGVVREKKREELKG